MLKKIVSFMLTFLILFSIVIPTNAASMWDSWVKCSVDDQSMVTIEWDSFFQIKRLEIIRTGVTFKKYTENIPNTGKFSFTETDKGTFDYEVLIYGTGFMGDFLIAKTAQKVTVKGTGTPKIWLDFVNAYTNSNENTSYPIVDRVLNWVNIKNLGTTDLDLNKLLVRYFYTVDGEPSVVNQNYPNNGQQKAENSDGKIDPIEQYTESPAGRNNIQEKESIRMNFVKIPFNVMSIDNNVIVADYICETYFENTTEKINSNYSLRLQAGFDKSNLTSLESNDLFNTYIRKYNLTNDFSFNNNQNIAVYYEGEKIWGLDPTIIAPVLTGVYNNFKIDLNWSDSPGATGYIVYRSESSNGPFNTIAVNIPDSNYTDTAIEKPGQSIGKKYYYKVVALYDATQTKIKHTLKSDDSNIVCIAIGELQAPTNLTARIVDKKNVELNWNESQYATQYNIYRSETENGTYTQIKSGVNGTSFIDNTTVVNGLTKSYYYKVKAAYGFSDGSIIESPFSNSVEARILNLQKPSNLTAKLVNIKNAELEWDNVEGVVGYRIYRSNSENGVYNLLRAVPNNDAFEDTTTIMNHNSNNYYYRVSALYKINGSTFESDKSDSASITTPRKTLVAPNDLKAKTKGARDVLLNWTPSEGALKYIIYRSENKTTDFDPIDTIDAVNNNGGLVSSYLDTSVPEVTNSDGKKYYYKLIAAYDDTNKSNFSNTAEVLVKVFVGGENDYWSWYCNVLSNSSKFVMGTYIPLSFTVKFKEDASNLSLFLNEDLLNSSESINPSTYIVSNTNDGKYKLINVTQNNEDIKTNVKIEESKTESKYLSRNAKLGQINIYKTFKKGDEITIEFAVKTATNKDIISRGINNYYSDKNDSSKYDFTFVIEATVNSDTKSQTAATNSKNSLGIKLLSPNKLQ